jgi:hypothetical protein
MKAKNLSQNLSQKKGLKNLSQKLGVKNLSASLASLPA